MIASSKRFSFDEQLVISEIDIEKLSNDRQKNSAFQLGKRQIDSPAEAAYAIDRETKVVAWNAAMEALTGVAATSASRSAASA